MKITNKMVSLNGSSHKMLVLFSHFSGDVVTIYKFTRYIVDVLRTMTCYLSALRICHSLKIVAGLCHIE